MARKFMPEHIVKGYEIAPDRYVIVSQEELEALAPKASRTIEDSRFRGYRGDRSAVL
jgi:DNA end-binding protein Ku